MANLHALDAWEFASFDLTPCPHQMEIPQAHHSPAAQRMRVQGERLGRSAGEVAALQSGSKWQEVLPVVRSLEKLSVDAGLQCRTAEPSENPRYLQGQRVLHSSRVQKEGQPGLPAV